MAVDLKTLKKLAAACRKAGIKSFKSPDFEFTLTDAEPEPAKKAKGSTPAASPNTPIVTDEPTAEELLFWSVGNEPVNEEAQQ